MSDLIERIERDRVYGTQHAFSMPYSEMLSRILADAEALKAADALSECLQAAITYAGPSDSWVSLARQSLTAYRKARGGKA